MSNLQVITSPFHLYTYILSVIFLFLFEYERMIKFFQFFCQYRVPHFAVSSVEAPFDTSKISHLWALHVVPRTMVPLSWDFVMKKLARKATDCECLLLIVQQRHFYTYRLHRSDGKKIDGIPLGSWNDCRQVAGYDYLFFS